MKDWINVSVALIALVMVATGAWGCAKHEAVQMIDVVLVFLGALVAIVGVALNKNGHNGNGAPPQK